MQRFAAPAHEGSQSQNRLDLVHFVLFGNRRKWDDLPRLLSEHMANDFHELPNVLVTPYSSSSTEATADRRWSVVAANLDRFARGEALENIVLQTWPDIPRR
jgi:hypothetical protein